MTNSTLDLIPNDQKNIQGLTTYEYKHIRLDYKGRSITQEINLLDIMEKEYGPGEIILVMM